MFTDIRTFIHLNVSPLNINGHINWAGISYWNTSTHVDGFHSRPEGEYLVYGFAVNKDEPEQNEIIFEYSLPVFKYLKEKYNA